MREAFSLMSWLGDFILMFQGLTPPRPPVTVRMPPLSSLGLSKRLRDCFATLVDPRVERTRHHQLHDILTIAIWSVLAGGQGGEEMEV